MNPVHTRKVAQFLALAALAVLVPSAASGQPAGTGGTVLAVAPARPQLEVVFAIDTTGSMAGLIQAAKEKVWSIASSMAQTQPAPLIKIGLVAYRDRGDEYVTRRTELTANLDSIYEVLMSYQAGGGGDSEESVNQALHEAVTQMGWSKDPQVYKAIFLVGDYPPHMDYPNDIPFTTSCKEAATRGIFINTVQCGSVPETTTTWNKIAGLGEGSYFQVEQGGGELAVTTPYDAELAEAAAKLEATRLYYGSASSQAAGKMKAAAGRSIDAKASVTAKARRASFNVSAAGKDNLYGENELLNALDGKQVQLESLEKEELPEPMQAMNPEQQKRFVEENRQQRAKLESQIRDLTAKRKAHIDKELSTRSEAEKKGRFGQKVYDAVRSQAKSKAIDFSSDTVLE